MSVPIYCQQRINFGEIAKRLITGSSYKVETREPIEYDVIRK